MKKLSFFIFLIISLVSLSQNHKLKWTPDYAKLPYLINESNLKLVFNMDSIKIEGNPLSNYLSKQQGAANDISNQWNSLLSVIAPEKFQEKFNYESEGRKRVFMKLDTSQYKYIMKITPLNFYTINTKQYSGGGFHGNVMTPMLSAIVYFYKADLRMTIFSATDLSKPVYSAMLSNLTNSFSERSNDLFYDHVYSLFRRAGTETCVYLHKLIKKSS